MIGKEGGSQITETRDGVETGGWKRERGRGKKRVVIGQQEKKL